MKNKLIHYLVYSINYCLDIFYNCININKKKIFIYTDSRGYDVLSCFGKLPIYSYVSMIRKKYFVRYKICEHKYTTIVDFIDYISKKDITKYDIIILHCGVVDFSPRPISNLKNFIESKKKQYYFRKVFDYNKDYYKNTFEIEYQNEPTINIYSPDYLKEHVIPSIKLQNLIWINSNNFLDNWDGNYLKGRPKNIQTVVCQFEKVMDRHLYNIVDLKRWSESEIKSFTIDNIHFTKSGFKKIFHLIEEQIARIEK
ncbi:hypothetical protein EMA8858_02878 [Emticicia aquatica]|uniref:SGNH/GDSL hydrolase family protein n=1 Tax=Emticicia aquatica TaxID=1681835 RepID=A0ABM9ASU3_9BACT|nr:hypothetical protein [Emticicia aquatica]CAH0996743.1 hypothetical protein EMA8858_02878 [Emticicia aquatica]